MATPDLEAAAPLIDAVFGTAPPERRIPYRITGQAQRRINPVARALDALMALSAGRHAASARVRPAAAGAGGAALRPRRGGPGCDPRLDPGSRHPLGAGRRRAPHPRPACGRAPHLPRRPAAPLSGLRPGRSAGLHRRPRRQRQSGGPERPRPGPLLALRRGAAGAAQRAGGGRRAPRNGAPGSPPLWRPSSSHPPNGPRISRSVAGRHRRDGAEHGAGRTARRRAARGGAGGAGRTAGRPGPRRSPDRGGDLFRHQQPARPALPHRLRHRHERRRLPDRGPPARIRSHGAAAAARATGSAAATSATCSSTCCSPRASAST
ncbi:MAG: exodeoxyribonuclease V subunit gamma [Comamonadaceae bacterium]|nr:exodeoxyribonuclease V subunit gamma [Comamonadaceae bacterium]